jgi:hypothetical protein
MVDIPETEKTLKSAAHGYLVCRTSSGGVHLSPLSITAEGLVRLKQRMAAKTRFLEDDILAVYRSPDQPDSREAVWVQFRGHPGSVPQLYPMEAREFVWMTQLGIASYNKDYRPLAILVNNKLASLRENLLYDAGIGITPVTEFVCKSDLYSQGLAWFRLTDGSLDWALLGENMRKSLIDSFGASNEEKQRILQSSDAPRTIFSRREKPEPDEEIAVIEQPGREDSDVILSTGRKMFTLSKATAKHAGETGLFVRVPAIYVKDGMCHSADPRWRLLISPKTLDMERSGQKMLLCRSPKDLVFGCVPAVTGYMLKLKCGMLLNHWLLPGKCWKKIKQEALKNGH